MKTTINCPHCGKPVEKYRNPLPTVDIIIRVGEGVVLVKRKNPPHGWALPGGFIDYGESAEAAALREAREETSIELDHVEQFHVYSDPDRDPRHHTLTVVFSAYSRQQPRAADDAAEIGVFEPDKLPEPLAFDHRDILEDYFARHDDGR